MTGSLTVKHGKYYVITRFCDENGNKKQKWISLDIADAPGNKRKAQKKMRDILTELEEDETFFSEDISFSDWIDYWIDIKKTRVRQVTIESYQSYIEKHIKPFFNNKGLMLKDITTSHIQAYYSQKLNEGLSPNSIIKHNVVLNDALKEAVRKKKIKENPVHAATLPSPVRYRGKAYTADEATRLLEVVEDKTIKPAIILGLYYGLRREEVCGLRWSDINFEEGTMHICNTVVKMKTVIEQETTKSKASNRTLCLIPSTIPYLLSLKERHEQIQANSKNAHPDPQKHVCVLSNGKPFSPDYISMTFNRILERNNLPKIRFHDLRHTAGTLLLTNGVSPKHVSEYLGHEKTSMTLDIYTHLNMAGKKESAIKMDELLKL